MLSRTKTLGCRALIIGCALVLLAGSGIATEETIYLTDSGDPAQNTKLFKVLLDPVVVESPTPPQGIANLELVLEVTAPGYDQVDAFACDAGACWLIDKLSFNIGRYDLTSGTFQTMATLTYEGAPLPGVVLAGFSPNGQLYVASQDTERIYVVPNPANGVAEEVGPVEIDGQPLDLNGADLVFAATGELYLWTNGTGSLYELFLPAIIPGTVTGVPIVEQTLPYHMTGLTIRANGYGDLLGSVAMQVPGIQDHLNLIRRDGQPVPPFNSPLHPVFALYYNGLPYDYTFGDMSSGALRLCHRTIGYYKNHSWNDEVVPVCGHVFTEDDGMTVLWNATNRDFSMLIAQLIAAKLNVDSASGVPQIEAAEAFLCSPEVQAQLHENDPIWWSTPFASTEQKRQANELKNALDQFNNTNQCDENDGRNGGGRRLKSAAPGGSF